jgi:tryptophan halogenase
MKIAILGAGTAGFVAAAQFSQALPGAELLHVFDSQLPTIGVGEGTTPRFPGWFQDVTGLPFETLAERCGATLKTGTQFEGWGSRGDTFLNRFQPVRLVGYHFDAASVVQVLAEHVRATRVDARVTALLRQTDGVQLQLHDGRLVLCDTSLTAAASHALPTRARAAKTRSCRRTGFLPAAPCCAAWRRVPSAA